ncbi:hypothetical protein ACFSQ7_08210 [Paenibacillus rhizoplanae]
MEDLFWTEDRDKDASKKAWKSFFRSLLGLVIIAAAAFWVVYYVLPNRQHLDPDWKGLDKPIFL